MDRLEEWELWAEFDQRFRALCHQFADDISDLVRELDAAEMKRVLLERDRMAFEADTFGRSWAALRGPAVMCGSPAPVPGQEHEG